MLQYSIRMPPKKKQKTGANSSAPVPEEEAVHANSSEVSSQASDESEDIGRKVGIGL